MTRSAPHVALFVACILLLGPATVAAESLYNANSYRSLVSDHRANRQGDTLTVLVHETASAETSASNEAGQSADVGATANVGSKSESFDLSLSDGFDGEGTLRRQGQLVATVSVEITEVLPNGDYRIFGHQVLEFNEETQFIRLRGRVRPDDITAENMVLSSRIANASIRYTGEGFLGNTQEPGIISRFFNWLF